MLLFQAPILPSDPRIVYVGRFDRHDPAVATAQWSASEARLRVAGPVLRVTIEEKGTDFLEVVVDGRPLDSVALKAGVDAYTFDLGPGEHIVRLVKRTEPFVGTLTFRGFETPGGTLKKAVPRKRHLEFVGDSITCGFGNEGKDKSEPFKPSTENAYLSYASIAARLVDADATLVAWSGRKMWPDNTTPSVYDDVLPNGGGPKWDFRGPAPDAVVINLATNDFGRENPEEKGWTDAYEAFVRRVWSHYPKAHVYATIGSMMTDGYPQGHLALSTLRGYLTRLVQRVHDPRLTLLEFEPQRAEDGYGAAWHPSVRTDEKMGARLAAALKKDLRW